MATARTAPMVAALISLLLLLSSGVDASSTPKSNLRSNSNNNNADTPQRKKTQLHNILQMGEPPLHAQKRNRARQLQTEGGSVPQNCTDTVPKFGFFEEDLHTGECIENWPQKEWQFYPYDFQGLTNKVAHYVCPASNKRIIASNGIPNHAVRIESDNMPCEKFWFLDLPLQPEYLPDQTLEPSPMGIVAMALNGVPMFGAQEVFGGNAVEPDMDAADKVLDARFWYGHATGLNIQHYHNPASGQEQPSDSDLLGYALDGFPVYGPISDESQLDECNGILMADGSYRYHVRSVDQVDDSQPYCSADGSSVVNWKYIVGCFKGNMSNTHFDTTNWYSYRLDEWVPDDCYLDPDLPSNFDYVAPAPAPAATRPNIIIVQPDDLPFFQDWTPPPNNPASADKEHPFPSTFTMPNVERLRTQGVQMNQAYTTSPGCGTSRFSTITGKYPSRSSYSRKTAADLQKQAAKVTIPRTKLEDLQGYDNDCSVENLVATFQNNGYRTGVVGKWHLTLTEGETYSYNWYRDQVKNCGFDFAEALFAENLDDETLHGVEELLSGSEKFNHNMEWVTAEAIDFINGDYEGAEDDKPFLLYFNPTVPHSSGSVEEALTDDRFVCTVTADVGNPLPEDPLIKGMTLEYGGCVPYRETVAQRAGGIHNSNENLGAVWVDDSVGALLHALMDKGIFEDTLILFQIDHGIEAKQTLYENGNRVVQFIHYPNAFGTDGKEFDGLVSTIDIAPTLFDFAGITNYYNLDGKSWKDAIDDVDAELAWEHDRCLLFENQYDRAVRCGCNKFMTLRGENAAADLSLTYTQGIEFGFNADYKHFMHLCDPTTEKYISYPNANPEADNYYDPNGNGVLNMYQTVMECFRNATRPMEEPDFSPNCEQHYDAALVKERTCYADTDCAGNTIRPYCNTETRTCIQCTEDGHCPGGSPKTDHIYCQVDTKTCAVCLGDAHCPTGETCNVEDGVCEGPVS